MQVKLRTANHRRKRSKAAFVLFVAAALLLGGAGSRIIESYDGLADVNTIASLSLAVSGVPEKAFPVTLLDIDDRTREAWHARAKIPHSALAALIDIAASRDAKAVILDVDLSGDALDEPPDGSLQTLLMNYPADAPTLLLARRIVFERKRDGQLIPTSSLATPYDATVSGRPNIRWVTTLNDIDRDRTVRRIRLWQSVCGENERTTYPSAALAAGLTLLPQEDTRSSLSAFLTSRAAADCNMADVPLAPWPGARVQAVAIPFIVPDRPDAGIKSPITHDAQASPLLWRLSARHIVPADGTGPPPAAEIDARPFAGRIVMIGATDAASGDLYNTPFGTMPGVLVIANSVIQADRILNSAPMPGWVRNAAIFLGFLAFFHVSRRFQGAVTTLLISLMSFCLLFLITRIFSLADGVSVVATAIAGLALFKLLESLLKLVLDLPSRGWRAVFRE